MKVVLSIISYYNGNLEPTSTEQ